MSGCGCRGCDEEGCVQCGGGVSVGVGWVVYQSVGSGAVGVIVGVGIRDRWCVCQVSMGRSRCGRGDHRCVVLLLGRCRLGRYSGAQSPNARVG